KKNLFLSLVLAVTLLAAFTPFKKEQLPIADKIFINGNIITVDDKNAIMEAVAIKDGKILAVGKTTEVNKHKGQNTLVIDLKGKAMIPGFIDGHSHFMGLGRSRSIDLSPPPVGTVKN